VPGKRAKGERGLEDALAALAGALDETGAPWMVIGGIAYGVRRFTTDSNAAAVCTKVRSVARALRCFCS
jgi:hypothetical protein